MKLDALFDYQRIARATPREVTLLLRLTAPPATRTDRTPLNLAVIVDRSGSMDGEKLSHTRKAIQTLITHLDAQDRLCVVLFDTHVETLLPPTPVQDKDALKTIVNRIESGSATNLSGGWLQGIRLLSESAAPDRINRCLLLTDGQANQGLTDPPRLAHLGRSAREKSNIVTTTLGFGEDFNEDLLTAMAREAGGSFYFVDTPEQAPAIFAEELSGLLELAAQNVEVVLHPGPATLRVEQWTGYPASQSGQDIAFRLGDAYAGETKNLLLRLHLDALTEIGKAGVASITVQFDEMTRDAVKSKRLTDTVYVEVADGVDDAPPCLEVLREYALQRSARARDRAVEAADRGDHETAKGVLREVVEELQQIPDPDAILAEEIADLQVQASQWNEAQYTTTRKMMRESSFSTATGRNTQARAARERRRPPKA